MTGSLIDIVLLLLCIDGLCAFSTISRAGSSWRVRTNRLSITMGASVSDAFDSAEVQAGKFRIVASEEEISGSKCNNLGTETIMLGDVQSGWGNGKHPTTKLCLDFITENVKPGNKVLDYGCGSGILSILAAKLGAVSCLAVEIDEDSLIAAANNADLNGVGDRVEVIHTRHVYIGDDSIQPADVTVADILPGALNRLVAPLWMLTKPGGRICLSGLRPHELPAIRAIYAPYMNMNTEDTRTACHDVYGEWVSWSVQTKIMSPEETAEALNRLTQGALD